MISAYHISTIPKKHRRLGECLRWVSLLKVPLILLFLMLFTGGSEAAFTPKGQIVAIYGGSVTIDIGLGGDARRGDLYLVYRGNTPLAVLQVTNSSEKFSMCSMTSYLTAGTPRVGDYVTPAGTAWPSELAYTQPPDHFPIEPIFQNPMSRPYQYAMPQENAPYPIYHMLYPYAHLYADSTPQSRFSTIDFDVNTVTDERLLRAFPISVGARNYLGIRFRVAYNFYRQGKFREALEVFSDESVLSLYPGNYLFPYWAGLSAARLGDRQRAAELFNRALEINPLYEPARREVTAGM